MHCESKIFELVSEEKIKQLSEMHFLQKRLKKIETVSGGLFNTTYSVLIEMAGEYIFRFGPVNRHLLLPFEAKLMENEKYAYGVLKKAHLPVPAVAIYDTSHQSLDRDYAIVEKISGNALNQVALSEIELFKIYKELGKYVKQMHQIKRNRFGYIADVEKGCGYESWFSFFWDEVCSICESMKKFHVLSTEELKKVIDIIQKNRPYLEEIKTASFVHADIWDGNILVDYQQGKWRITGIIDAERAVFGDPYFEFAGNFITNPALFDGYGEIPLPGTVEQRKLCYLLFFTLINIYVWKVEYAKESVCRGYKKELYKLLANAEKPKDNN